MAPTFAPLSPAAKDLYTSRWLDEKTILAVVAAVGTIVSALAALGGICIGWWLKVRSDEALWNLEQRLSSYVTLLNHIDAYSLLATQLYRADDANLLTRKTNTQESYSTVDSAITVVELLCPNGLRGASALSLLLGHWLAYRTELE